MDPQLVHKEDIEANDYNPNRVPDPELRGLEKSIRSNGMTMPIVTFKRDDETYEIVDGFHRYLVLTEWIGEDWIPVSVIDKPLGERMMATVEHNAFRGDHKTELMGSLVESLEEEGFTPEEIAEELEKEKEEIIRLKQVVGAADEMAADQYGQSWGVQDDDES
ncbi:ParB N-terminal domain-containing protein [Halocatena halophila]|uniref:ParB N-terminal domain-containing protein n=1 Tax=Halocatena halophila TaxID=2814576 RepID=UPI002ED09023